MRFFEDLFTDNSDAGRCLDAAIQSNFNEPSGNWSSPDPFNL